MTQEALDFMAHMAVVGFIFATIFRQNKQDKRLDAIEQKLRKDSK
jgi:hypothetical protein